MNGAEGNSILGVLLACVLASVILGGLTIYLARAGKITSRRGTLGMAILTVLPLFGAGFAMMSMHVYEQATGETKSGVDRAAPR